MHLLLALAAVFLVGGEIRVAVAGEVRVAGEHLLPAGATILRALDAAGGVLPTADLSRAILQREHSSDVIPVDLARITSLGDLAQNYGLRDGDRLTVLRKTRSSVWVRAGSVVRPIEFEAGLTALEALRRARWLASGDSDRIRIERWGPNGGTVRHEYTLKHLLSADPGGQKLRPGDVIEVSGGTLRD